MTVNKEIVVAYNAEIEATYKKQHKNYKPLKYTLHNFLISFTSGCRLLL